MSAMTRLLGPAVALMNRLRYPQKFALISSLFAIPIAFMMILWLIELHSRMAFTARERAGVELVVALNHVLEPLEASRGLRSLATAGDASATERLAKERIRLAAAATVMDATNEHVGRQLGVRELWQSMRARVVHPAVDPASLAAQMRQLNEQISDASNLSLDVDLDSYYLAEAVTRRLPALADALAAIGADEIEQRLSGVWPPLRQSTVLTEVGLARAERDALDRGHMVAFRENPDLRSRLEGSLATIWGAVDGVNALTSADGTKRARPEVGAAEVYERQAGVVAAVFRHSDAAASNLDILLRARMDRLALKRLGLLTVVLVTMLGVAYLWVGFYASVKRAVTSLDGVTRRMLTGEFTGPVVVEGRDELRQVVDSFNTVAGRLRTEWQRAQDESARARAAEASLAKARDAAEAATRAKSEFLAVMSHEIRTPMNGVLGMAHLLLETPLDAQQRQYAATVRDSGQALLDILNDILDFSKMEAGKLDLDEEDFDLSGVVSSVVTLLAVRAREKGFALDVVIAPEVPRALRGDPGRLRQVLLNLVGNAIKFTDHGSVRVDVTRVGERGGRTALRFEVTDSGPGIPLEAQPRLFQEFTQVDQLATRRAGGTGLGLAISRKIVTAMQGEIGVRSSPGHGSTFWFTVALAPAQGEVVVEAATSEPQVRPLRILVAEDNPVNQQVALGLLRRRGHSVDVVATGRAAVEAVARRSYDVVLMDVHMPEMDGIEATRQIRRLPGEAGQVPIIALSASAMKDETDACMAAGMLGHLAKPIDPVALAATLSHYAGAAPAREPAAVSAPAVGEALGEAVGEVVDEAYVRLLVDSLGAAKVAQLVADLPAHARPHRARLGAASADADLPQIQAAAHALAGMAANLGLTALAELTGAIEDACRAGRVTEVATLCAGLDARFDDALTRIEALCSDRSRM
jgi:signal transduction histidine kinase/HPt (histidine-containing phosphotransfer) domain-containing protein/ActR/RegA family two-component response regulator